MRLIDADDIGKYLFDWFERSRSYNPYDTSNTIYISDVLNIINDMPTIEERKVGKWEEREICDKPNVIEEWQSAQCSNCGLYHTTPYMYYFDNYKYCPNCGAKMENIDRYFKKEET